MTRKEFLTNLIRDLGFEVQEYVSDHSLAKVRVVEGPYFGTVHVWTDRSRTNPERVSVKFKWCSCMNHLPDSPQAIEMQRKARAWLAQRGFEAIVDWSKYRGSEKGVGYLRIRSIGHPWNQCAKAVSKEKALEDALTVQRRFRGTGNVLEED